MTDEEAVQAAVQTQNPNISMTPVPLTKEVQEWVSSVSPGVFSNAKEIQNAWNHPAAQFVVALTRDASFKGAMGEISQKFDSHTFLGYEFGWVLLIWIVRAWRLSKCNTWLTRIWTQAWVSSLFWWGSLFFVPWLLWGKSYQMVLATVFRALIHQFWT